MNQQTKENPDMATDNVKMAEDALASMIPSGQQPAPRAPQNGHRPGSPDQPNGVIGATHTLADSNRLCRDTMSGKA